MKNLLSHLKRRRHTFIAPLRESDPILLTNATYVPNLAWHNGAVDR